MTEEHRVLGNGMRLCLCSWGEPHPERSPVLILHGFLDQSASWAGVAEELRRQGHAVLAPDHRGHGRSAHVGAGGYYHFPDYVVDLDLLLQQLLLPGQRVHLVGHSMGGTVASLYAASRPERLASLVLVEGLGPPSVDDRAAAERLVTHLDHLRAPPRHRPIASLAEATERLLRMNAGMGAHAEALARRLLVEREDGQLEWGWDALHRTRAPVAFQLGRHLEILRRIQAPTTLVFGSRSTYLLLDHLAERIAALPGARRVDLPAGHMVHLDAPASLAACITESAAQAL